MGVKKNKTVFAESRAVVTASPYDKFREEDLDLVYDQQGELSKFESARLKLECVNIAGQLLTTSDTAKIFPCAKKIWKFITSEE